MVHLTHNKWTKINDFLSSISSAGSVDELHSRLFDDIPALIRFENSGVLMRLENFKPTIQKSVNSGKKWNDMFNSYYYTVSKGPDFGKNIFSANNHDLKRHHKSEYYYDFLVPQGISFTTGFIVFDHDNKPAYTMVLNRTKSERMYSPEELTVMKIIQPHITNFYKMLCSLEQFRKMPIIASELETDNHLLSMRESEILYLLMQRLKPVAISKELNISIFTVRKHIQNIYEKLKVVDRRQLFQKINLDFKKNNV